MLKIYLARHGQDKDNADGILNGRRDKPLTPKGKAQAMEVAEKIKDSGIKFDKVYSSPLMRAYKTAEIITNVLGIEKPSKMAELIERDFGILTGKKHKDIRKLSDKYMFTEITGFDYILKAKGLEDFPTVIIRAQKLIKLLNSLHKDGNILLVTHGDTGKMIYAAYYNLRWKDVLRQFHFGNSDLLLLSQDSPPQESHVFKIAQHNL